MEKLDYMEMLADFARELAGTKQAQKDTTGMIRSGFKELLNKTNSASEKALIRVILEQDNRIAELERELKCH